MYQVKVYNRQTEEIIMESNVFETIEEAKDAMFRIGSGESYYSVIYIMQAIDLAEIFA